MKTIFGTFFVLFALLAHVRAQGEETETVDLEPLDTDIMGDVTEEIFGTESSFFESKLRTLLVW